MYATFGNQIYHLLHYFLAFGLVMIFVPATLFNRTYDKTLDQMVVNYIKMVFYIIIVGYVLVVLQLYEVLALIFLYVLILSFKKPERSYESPRAKNLLIRLFDILDGIIKVNIQTIKIAQRNIKDSLNKWWDTKKNVSSILGLLLFWTIIGYSIVIRFYDPIVHAAPPLSDSYVTLAWMKYINNRQLFHDGIYPQGFHIYLATLFKFAGIDALYILKYTGPFNMVLVILGFYYVIYRLTKNKIAALISSFVYGVAVQWEGNYPIERQVATNSQEFAFVFVFLSLYFFLRFYKRRKKQDLLVGFLGTAVVGLVHSLAFAFLGMAIGLLLLTAFILERKHSWRWIMKTSVAALATVIISALPLIVGLLLGKELHSSSESYLTSTSTKLQSPLLHPLDVITLLMVVVIGFSLIFRKWEEEEPFYFIRLFAFLLGTFTFVFYYFGPGLTNSVLVASRSVDLWFLTMPFIIGLGWHVLFNLFTPQLEKYNGQLILAVVACVAFVAIIRPGVIHPYKMQWDSSVEQYLKIRENYRPKTWMIVSQAEGYALVLGDGYHMYLQNFIDTYDPTKKPLTKFGNTKPDGNIPPDIFVFQPKNEFEVSPSNSIFPLMSPKYERRKQEDQRFMEWIKVYKSHHLPYSILYEDKNLIVYHFKRFQTKKEIQDSIWGSSKN